MPSRSQKYIKNWNNICSPSRKALIKAYLSLLSTKTFYHGGASARERYREKGWVKFLHLCRPSFLEEESSVHCSNYSLKCQDLNNLNLFKNSVYRNMYEMLPSLVPASFRQSRKYPFVMLCFILVIYWGVLKLLTFFSI